MSKKSTCTVAVAGLLTAALCVGASADTIFFDDFNDGNATDGSPVTWVPVPGFPGTFDASSGDYLLAPSDRSIVATVPQFMPANVSVRTQVRFLEPSSPGGVEILARANRAAVTAYQAGLNEEGGVYLRRTDLDCCFAEANTTLRPLEEDVILQLDVFGNSLRMWAWRPGEPMPVAPLITATDNGFSQGEVGIDYWTLGSSSALGSAHFRYVHVADSHIPEPSAAIALLLSGTFMAVIFRRNSWIKMAHSSRLMA